eukprot:g28.t1
MALAKKTQEQRQKAEFEEGQKQLRQATAEREKAERLEHERRLKERAQALRMIDEAKIAQAEKAKKREEEAHLRPPERDRFWKVETWTLREEGHPHWKSILNYFGSVPAEDLEEGLRFSYKLNKILASTQSKFQQVDVCDTVPFGKVLIIDGLIQSSELDEFIYHECLVHPAMLAHPNPKRATRCGGGEGSTAREVLRHKSVEKCVMVDIDGDVVDFCKDLAQMCKEKLNPGGILVTQASGAGVKMYKAVLSPVLNTLKQVFPAARAYKEAVYSFADEWGFVIGHSDPSTASITPEEVDRRIAERITGSLQFLDGESYTGIFCLSKQMRSDLSAETRILSKDNPAVFLSHMEGVSQQQEMLEKQEADRAAYFQQMRDKQSKMLAAYEAGVGNELEKKMREDEERAKRYQQIAEEKERMKMEMREKRMKQNIRLRKASHEYIQMQLQERQLRKQQAREEELQLLERLKAQEEALNQREQAKIEAKRRALQANAENLREQIRLKNEEVPSRYARDQMNEVERKFNKAKLEKALSARQDSGEMQRQTERATPLKLSPSEL